MRRWGAVILAMICLLTVSTTFSEEVIAGPTIPLEPYTDIRANPAFEQTVHDYEAGEFDPEDIPTYTFNQNNVLFGSEMIMAEVMEAGKNPGLGVRGLHAEGITGKGVRVAIIDQPLLLDHPEFAGKIVEYLDTDAEGIEGMGSMHGPAVASLLVGETIGTAPDAVLYYAATPSWKKDSQYIADALEWIIEENEKLPEGDKIRVVSISAAPSGEGSPFEENKKSYHDMVIRAQEAGILVLDCRGSEPSTGWIAAGYYDLDDPNDVSKFTVGFANSGEYTNAMPDHYIIAPTSRRTLAEQYMQEDTSLYQYAGVGGFSWAVPYVAGVLAMGWQVAPELGGEALMQVLLDTAYTNEYSNHIINPVAFIGALQSK